PGVLVSTASQLELARPEVPSVACGEAVTPVCPMTTVVLLNVGARAGAVLSSLNDPLTGGCSALPFVSIEAGGTVCCASAATLASEHATFGRSPKLDGTLAGSRTHRVCATVPAASVADTVTPTVLLYQPFEPSGEAGLSVIVVVGASSEASYA